MEITPQHTPQFLVFKIRISVQICICNQNVFDRRARRNTLIQLTITSGSQMSFEFLHRITATNEAAIGIYMYII